MTLEHLGYQVIEMNRNRKHFERTPEELATQIRDEAQELVDEIQEAMITDNAFAVASEIGDLYVLLAQICDQLGINPVDAMKMKVQRNQYKYPDYTMNNGYTQPDAMRLSKEVWKAQGGDSTFSHIYLDYLAELPEEVIIYEQG